VKPQEWALVPSSESVPKQENTSDCGAFICMFGYFISQDASLVFSQVDVTNFRKRMALAIINFANNTEVQADSVEDSSSSSNDIQETEPVGCDVSQGFPDHEILSSSYDLSRRKTKSNQN
jgi:Ulp1 family protease